MKKKGFTLIEMLGVIVILGILSGIVTLAVGYILRYSRIKLAKKQEEELTQLAATIYTHESIPNRKGNFMKLYKKLYKSNKNFYIETDDLVNSGYLDGKIKNPAGGDYCSGYIFFSISNKKFNGYLCCKNLYYNPDGYNNNCSDKLKGGATKLYWNDGWEE